MYRLFTSLRVSVNGKEIRHVNQRIEGASLPAIKNFGYLWDRDRVFWGKGRASGTLLGSNPQYGIVDFREQKGIYLLHSRDLKIVYVGQVGSGNQGLLARLRQHRKSEDLWNRWQYFSWFGWRNVNRGGPPKERLSNHGGGAPTVKGSTEDFLNEIEALIIQVVEPPLNRQGPRWMDTVQFTQEDDAKLELSDLPTIAQSLADLAATVDVLVKREKK